LQRLVQSYKPFLNTGNAANY